MYSRTLIYGISLEIAQTPSLIIKFSIAPREQNNMLQFIRVLGVFLQTKVIKSSLPELQNEIYVSVLMWHKSMVQNSFLGKDKLTCMVY